VFNVFAQHGILVKGIDLRGHGRTYQRAKESNSKDGGIQGHTQGMETVWEDLLQVLNIDYEQYANIPVFVVNFFPFFFFFGLNLLNFFFFKKIF